MPTLGAPAGGGVHGGAGGVSAQSYLGRGQTVGKGPSPEGQASSGWAHTEGLNLKSPSWGATGRAQVSAGRGPSQKGTFQGALMW